MNNNNESQNIIANINDRIFKQYKRNESINAHSENLLLLAKNFGDKADILFCQELIRTRDKNNGLTPTQSGEGYNRIHVKLYPIFKRYQKAIFNHKNPKP